MNRAKMAPDIGTSIPEPCGPAREHCRGDQSYGGAGHKQHGIDFMNSKQMNIHVWALE